MQEKTALSFKDVQNWNSSILYLSDTTTVHKTITLVGKEENYGFLTEERHEKFSCLAHVCLTTLSGL